MNRHKKKIIRKKKKKRKREDCTLKRIEGTEYMAFELSKEKKISQKKKEEKKEKLLRKFSSYLMQALSMASLNAWRFALKDEL